MNRQVVLGRVFARRRGGCAVISGALLASLLSVVAGPPDEAGAARPYCDGAADGTCLPTPAECATGRFNGRWTKANNPFAFADCVGYVDPSGQRHIAHYEAGSVNPVCGLSVENDRLVAGGMWQDPNRCLLDSPKRADAEQADAQEGTRYSGAVSGAGGVVASVSEAASEAGLDMLRAGGNAVDAAVAAVFAVGVTNPETCGIGAGGFLLARTADGRVHALDFRETAPKAMTATSLAVKGINQRGTGHLVIGVPGTVAGMAEALRVLGTKSLRETIAAAEALARKGPEVSMSTANEYVLSGTPKNEERLQTFPEAARIYLHNGHGYFPGALLRQSDYAKSLALIAKYGPEAFYQNKEYPEGKSVGALIVEEMERSREHPVTRAEDPDPDGDRSLMTAEDLAAYRAVWRKPLRGTYRGYDILSVPPPNAGGIQIQQVFNIVESLGPTGKLHASAKRFHVLVEAHKLARADREAYVADPDYEDVPTAQLTSPGYAAGRAAEIVDSASSFDPGNVPGHEPEATTTEGAEGGNTTHVSVIDRAGNAVAVTCTLEQAFGSAVVAPGTGFLLNNQLSDFSPAGTVNEAAGGKRPRSNTTPTIVVRDGRAVLVLGGMGGPTIPMGVVHIVTNVVDLDMDVADAVDAARVYPSDAAGLAPIVIEDARLPENVVSALLGKGHPKVPPPGVSPDTPTEYWHVPIMQVAGDLGGTRVAVSDSRSDFGASAETR